MLAPEPMSSRPRLSLLASYCQNGVVAPEPCRVTVLPITSTVPAAGASMDRLEPPVVVPPVVVPPVVVPPVVVPPVVVEELNGSSRRKPFQPVASMLPVAP